MRLGARLNHMTNELIAGPETATGQRLAGEITDKKGYGLRWGFSARHIDNLIAQGLPHLKVGSRRVRIEVGPADEWMRRRFGRQRHGKSRNTASQPVTPS